MRGADMRGLYAYPEPDGRWRIVAFSGSTYYLRERFRAVGGIWDGAHWRIPASAIADFPAIKKMVRVEHDGYCHEPAGEAFATESELQSGEMWGDFCGRCDSSVGRYPIRPACEKAVKP